MTSLRRKLTPLDEDVKDFLYTASGQITLPPSRILIDGALYTNLSPTVFDFSNGTGDNGIDEGIQTPNRWYAMYAVPKTGTSNYILKATFNKPDLVPGPTGFIKYRYLGIFRNNNSSAIIEFAKIKDVFQFRNPNAHIVQSAASTASLAWTLDGVMSGGFPLDSAILLMRGFHDQGSSMRYQYGGDNSTFVGFAATDTNATYGAQWLAMRRFTGGGQMAVQANNGAVMPNVNIALSGWQDSLLKGMR